MVSKEPKDGTNPEEVVEFAFLHHFLELRRRKCENGMVGGLSKRSSLYSLRGSRLDAVYRTC